MNDANSLKPMLKEAYAKKVKSPFKKLKEKLKRNMKDGKVAELPKLKKV
jgi:hypothetical protein